MQLFNCQHYYNISIKELVIPESFTIKFIFLSINPLDTFNFAVFISIDFNQI